MSTNFFRLLILFTLIQQTALSQNIVIGKFDTISSAILKEKRVIRIYQPNQNRVIDAPQERYPVIYLLDGDWHFSSVVGITEQLSYINGNNICPEMIIVGISILDRYRDLTPSRDTNWSKTSGENSKFISFIKQELIPYIDSNYPSSVYRIFIGHSLGGLTVINTLVTDPDLFNAYVAIDPSMWWDNQSSLKETKIALSEKTYNNINLYLAIANSMDRDMDTLKVRNDKTRNTLPIRSLLEFSDHLKLCNGNKLNYKVKYYPDENHGSVPLKATYDALRFIFDFYNLQLTKKDYADTSMSLGIRIVNHYKNISEKMGYLIVPSEEFINTLGYNALYMSNYKLAQYFFSLNISNYPDSFNAYDSYGDYFVATGDRNEAVKMYEKSLSIRESQETRRKLERISVE